MIFQIRLKTCCKNIDRNWETGNYHDYSSNTLTAAMNNHQQRLSLQQCGERHGIPFSTIQKYGKRSFFCHMVVRQLSHKHKKKNC